MAWNEPGNSGGKDPWGGRNSEQGPPDLDEVVRKLQDKFGGLFGQGRGRNGGGASAGSAGLVLLLAVVLWALSGIYIVDATQRGVVMQFGAYKATTMPGLNWFPRFIQTVEKVDISSVRSIELGRRADEALMLTQDENIIDVKFTVQYQVKDARDYLFNVRDPDQTLREATESAVREVIGQSEMDFVITGGRADVVDRIKTLVQEILDRYRTGLTVVNLNMQDAQAPEQVQGAFADAVKAREDEQRLKNEAEAYANDILPKARGQAARLIEEANAYRDQVIAQAEGESARFLSVLAQYEKAPAVTRKRLYLDAMESVLAQSSKVLVDTKGGNNLLYLPLDKLMQRETPLGSMGAGDTLGTVPAAPAQQPRADVRLRDNLRQREVR
ncbi:MAG: FtsH protease activity modulator HflK [Thiohalomonadaceae bacterium]